MPAFAATSSRFSLGRQLMLAAMILICHRACFAADAATGPAASQPTTAVSYYRDVLPILQANCHGCHQPAKASGALELTAFKNLLTAGESGTPAIVPGKPDESFIVEQITPTEGEAAMPQGKSPLEASHIALIRRWIEEGARDDTPANSEPPIDAAHPPVYSGPPVITSLDWSPDGTLLAIAGFHEVLLHKADGTGLVARLVGMAERIESVRFSPDGTKLAVTGGRPARMGEVQIWNIAAKTGDAITGFVPELLHSIPVTHDSAFGASWSPDGKRLAFGCTDSSVRAVDTETGEQVLFQSAHDDWVLDTVFSVDGSHLASVGRDMAAKLIEVATQRFVDNITSITPGALKGGIQSVERHPLRDEILMGGADGIPRIYGMHRTTARAIGDDANLLWQLPPLPGRIFSVDITPDGRVIAAASSLDGHGHVHVYRMEPAPTIPGEIQAILHKPTYQHTEQEKSQLQKHFDANILPLAKAEVAEGGVYAVALSPSGDRVAAAGGDGMVRLIETQGGTVVAAFSPVEITKGEDAAAAVTVAASLPGADPSLAEAGLRDEAPLPSGDAVIALLVEPVTITLDGPARYAQIVVMAELASGAKVDVTRQVAYELSAPVGTIDSAGLLTPGGNGAAVLTVKLSDKSATADVQVSNLESPPRPDFIRDIAPILARAGCNAGTCHGAQAGKNGFKLSLRGYDAVFDVRALTDDLASRRVNVASPADSLMLLKTTASVPHQGGQVIKPGSLYYEALRQWIADGARLDVTSSRVNRLEITPANPVVESIGSLQQVRVVAFYTDGSQRDVTREAFLESSNTDVVKTLPEQPGLLEALRRGEAAVLVRYEGNYAATTLTVMGDRSGFQWEETPAHNRIDELVAAKLQRTKTLPSSLADDYEFVRRVYLDLTGLPPTPEQVQTFVGDPSEMRTKRDALIERLIGSDDYIEYWTNKWADLLMVNRKFLGVEGSVALRGWIRGELAANTPYNQFVHKILTASGSTKENPAAAYYKILRTPQALMENTTHLFLATRFNCNKCHDHPFERWTQDQYYELAAYFAQVGLTKDPAGGEAMIGGSAVEAGQPLYEIVSDLPQGDVKHDRTGAVAPPEFPFECKHETKDGATRREQLAAWITSPDNPYFARSYVNRIWGYLTGRGIIEPLDDIRAGNPAANPELLDYLTTEFIDSGFNTRHLIGLVCKSRTYQLSVETSRWNEDDGINFSHARARRLPAEVLYDAIYRATGATSAFPGVPPGTRAATLPDVGAELADGFLGNLGRPARESACECERSSNLQLGPIMALVSGPTVGDAISDPDNHIAKLVAEVADNPELVNQLFLRFLSRPGKPDEVTAGSAMFEQLDNDHVAVVRALETYAAELSPKIAQREIERQNRIAGLQADIEAYREIVRLRRPRAEREREERIAKAAAALAEYDTQLAAKLSEWEASQSGKTAWHVVKPVEMGATYGAVLSRQDDGSIFVGGDKAKGAYRVVAPIPLERITGIRLEPLADDRLTNRGPGRSTSGNFVLTELAARWLPSAGPTKLVKSWDFSSGDDPWQVEEGAKATAESGMRYLFGGRQPAGITTSLKEPAGSYLLEIVTGIRSAVTIMVQWSTVNQPAFDETRSARRDLEAGEGGRIATPIVIAADAELTGLRIVVNGEESMLPVDAVRLFAAESAGYADIKLQNAQATFSQGGYVVASAIDGNATAEADNGWAIASEFGRDHAATFELATPLDGAKDRMLELMLHQKFADSQHSLGRFRISVTDAAPALNFGLSPEIAGILAKPAGERSDAERAALLARAREDDKRYMELKAEVAVQQQPLPEDPRLKQLEAELAAAQQPLPMEPKLQQLRRAVALSEEQLKNKRLTVAQDIVWALINNPAFLYNH
jgi:WD40 repeat protein/mono/diheme cytochrome c family protein